MVNVYLGKPTRFIAEVVIDPSAMMRQNATRLCEANFGALNLFENATTSVVAAMHNVPEAFGELRRREPRFRFGPDHPLGRIVATKQVLHITDLKAESDMPNKTHRIWRWSILLVPERSSSCRCLTKRTWSA